MIALLQNPHKSLQMPTIAAALPVLENQYQNMTIFVVSALMRVNDQGIKAPRPVAGFCATGRQSELLDLDVQRLDAVGDLARRHPEDAGGLGLDPAGLLQRSDDAFLF